VSNKILVVDDDVTSLDIVDLILEGEGFDVVRATNGKSAVAGVEESNPDLILIDLDDASNEWSRSCSPDPQQRH